MKTWWNRIFRKKYWTLETHDNCYIRSYKKLKRDYLFLLRNKLQATNLKEINKSTPPETRIAILLEKLEDLSEETLQEIFEELALSPRK